MNRTALKDKRITVILGGLSKEREVSLKTGTTIFDVLKAAGYRVSCFDPGREPLRRLSPQTTDIAFVALHGHYGEDGRMQGFLETLGIPYTGAGVLASALCFDKWRTKLFLKGYAVPMPASWLYTTDQDVAAFIRDNGIKPPVVTKPNREGSSIGMTIVHHPKDLPAAILMAGRFCDEVLVERYVDGKEVTVGVLSGTALPSVEIAPRSGFYDYEAKYTAGKTAYFVPARIRPATESLIKKMSEDIVRFLGCRGAPRVDFMLDREERPYFLEVNTIPGMTATSLLPKAARGAGMSFLELCEEILSSARLDETGSRST